MLYRVDAIVKAYELPAVPRPLVYSRRVEQMTRSQAEADAPRDNGEISLPEKIGLWPLTRYFLKLGTIGFGGQVALIAIMRSQSSM
jgi:hypothetical protein